VAARDRGQPPTQRREGQAHGPHADPRRRVAAAGLERFEVEREGLWRRWQRFEGVLLAERREVVPVMGVRAFRRRRVVGRRQVAIDGPRELGEERGGVADDDWRLEWGPFDAGLAAGGDLDAIGSCFHAPFFRS